MPYVMFCGLPSSGKTFLKDQLIDYLQNEQKKTVRVICDNDFIADKNSVYFGKFSILNFIEIIKYTLEKYF